MFRRFQLRRFEWGSFYMILSAFVSTFFGFSAKISMETVYLPLMVFLRFFVPLLIMTPYFIVRREGLKGIKLLSTGKHLLRALFVIISQYSLLHFFTKGSLTDGVLLWNLAPIFMPIITLVFLKLRTSNIVWLSIAVSFVGVICILKPTDSVFDPFSAYGFISGLAMAFSQVLYGVNREKDTLDHNLFLFFTYTSFLTFILMVGGVYVSGIQRAFVDSFYTAGTLIPLLAVAGVGIGTVFNQVLRGKAFQYAKPASLAPYIYLSVLFAAVIDFIQNPTHFQGFNFVIGMILLLMGTMIRILYTARA